MVNISQQLQYLVAITLDDPTKDVGCHTHSTALVNCLQNIAGLGSKEARECILCPVANTKQSQAVTCHQFELEGFCEDCNECEQKDCPTACFKEFDNWLQCKLSSIGCGGICKSEGIGEWEDNSPEFMIA